MRRRSRISTYQEKKNKKTIWLSIIGIILVLFILFKFGIEALTNFSLFLSGSKNSQNAGSSNNQLNFVASPILNPLPTATNSAQIIISGVSDKNRTIYLYINSKKIDEIETDSKGHFSTNENLSKGENIISAKAKFKEKESDFSNSYNVIFKNLAPKLDLTSPNDGQTFNKDQNKANVSGQTDSDVTITVNGFWAVIDENNSFSYLLPLQNGDNEIKIVAIDQAGNKTEKDLKVNYSQ